VVRSWAARRRLALSAVLAAAAISAPRAPILEYIRTTWSTLTRSHQSLPTAAVDPKFHPGPDGRWIVYVPQSEDAAAIQNTFPTLSIRSLPADTSRLQQQGLLYLPRPYVVPGGRFNEMYGWDSYFIQMGLLRDNLVPLARDMADNFLYEIRHYGHILNANRTYYLSRSQPPFLTQMLLAVYRRTLDRQWLENALPEIAAYYRYWITGPHLTASDLSRYFDEGTGPAPEVVAAERDSQGRTHYELAQQYFRTHKVTDYDVRQYYDAKNDRLTSQFYAGDRSMRESGFDPSDRFGPFSVDILNYNPVCLNSLLYLMEAEAAEIMGILNHESEVEAWKKRARERAALINKLMWDEHDGLYYDYDFVHHRLRRYPFLTTFYPLWAGIADRQQAARVAGNLVRFEQPGGLQTSTNPSGNQWDAPFGWAPLQYIAVEGLRRYGYRAEADRIATKFLTLVNDQYRQSGVIVEKYDVVHRSADLSGRIRFGYHSNEAGFGWTNAVYTALLDVLPKARRLGAIAKIEPAHDPNSIRLR
jgi:alpha,alpha-trehalase